MSMFKLSSDTVTELGASGTVAAITFNNGEQSWENPNKFLTLYLNE